MVDH
ncbi:ad989eaa-3547-41e5-9151-4583d46c3604 [Thermothielavioides terrestris]|jgi:hypothetical protein